MTARLASILILAAAVAVSGGTAVAQQSAPSQSRPAGPPEEGKEPDHIKVKHVLISFQGKLQGQALSRTQEEARVLAYEVLERARKGEDFDALMREYSNDTGPGIYSMANHGVRPGPGEYQRSGMVPAFGDTGFPLAVGEIGIADFHPRTSPYGWHIIKRVE